MASGRDPILWCLEDDDQARGTVRGALELRYQVEFIRDLKSLRERVLGEENRPVALLAELQLRDGSSFLEVLKDRTFVDKLSSPILVLSAVEDVDVLRFCFARGVADYLVKPANRIELVAKIERAVGSRIAILGIRLNPINHTVTRLGVTSRPLTPREYQLMTALHAAGTDAIEPSTLRAQLWPQSRVTAKALDVHLSHLRKKLSAIGVRIERLPKGLLIAAIDEDSAMGT